MNRAFIDTSVILRFLVKDDGDHYFQVVPDRWDLPTLFRQVLGRLRRTSASEEPE